MTSNYIQTLARKKMYIYIGFKHESILKDLESNSLWRGKNDLPILCLLFSLYFNITFHALTFCIL